MFPGAQSIMSQAVQIIQATRTRWLVVCGPSQPLCLAMVKRKPLTKYPLSHGMVLTFPYFSNGKKEAKEVEES